MCLSVKILISWGGISSWTAKEDSPDGRIRRGRKCHFQGYVNGLTCCLDSAFLVLGRGALEKHGSLLFIMIINP
jgi:hypothetical protein